PTCGYNQDRAIQSALCFHWARRVLIMRKTRIVPLSIATCAAWVVLLASAAAAPPTWDHIVIVIEENHSFSQVIGSPSAPYLNSLAVGGATLNSMYGITHPSQPNYLQFFSGAYQGVTN